MINRATLAALALFVPAAASAQSAGDFSEAAVSPVRYTLATAHPQSACASLRAAVPLDVTILAAEDSSATTGAVAVCRVRGVIAPAVQFEVRLPTDWNRRFYMFGNGGFAGENLDAPVRRNLAAAANRAGFVSAQTDTGHDAAREPLASFGASLPETVDYAFRAVHRTVEITKLLARAYYGRPITFSYWDSCSTGGREGLMSVQRFPADFDGVIAGAPVRNFVDTMVNYVWNAQALDGAGVTLPKARAVAQAELDRCDAADGVKDGVIADPRRCDFRAARDAKQCASGTDGDDCLTPREAEAVQRIEDGIRLHDGKPYFFGWPKGTGVVGAAPDGSGAVSGWEGWFVAPDGGPSRQTAYMTSFMQHLAFGLSAPGFDFRSFDFDKDPARMSAIRSLLVPDEADLSAFRSRGGKLLMYHGWADPALTPFMSIDYYQRALAANGAGTSDFFRLFMVPGMAHCRGGVATDRFDAISAMVNWVETGRAPDRLLAARMRDGAVDRTRPLCPFPQEAVYSGEGSVDAAENFRCAIP